MNISDVKKLIDKFLDGNSSLEEERILGDFFRKSLELPDELLPYKQMFTYFDKGMTDSNFLVSNENEDTVRRHSLKKSVRLKALSVIAVVSAAAAILLIYNVSFPDNLSSVRTSGGVLANEAELSDTIEVKADSITYRENNSQRHFDYQHKKWRYKPAPMKPLLAEDYGAQVSDSINEVAMQMADNELRKVEEEQQYVVNLIKAVDIINSAEIASVADDADVY